MATSPPPFLNILAAVWGPADVTGAVYQNVDRLSQTYTTNNSSNPPEVQDPWVGVKKTFAILYQYANGPINLFLTTDGNGIQTITPNSASKSFYLNPNGQKFGDRTNALAIIWGEMDNCGGPVPDSIYNNLYANGSLTCSNSAFGFDGFPNWQKTAIIFYRYGTSGKPYAVFAKEGSQLYLNK